MIDNPFSNIPAITEKKAQTLIEAGITSIPRLAMAKVRDLVELEGIQEATALKMIGAAQTATGIGNPRKANDVYRAWATNAKFLHTGSKAFDNLLGGGLRAGWIYEIAGRFGNGKSQTATQVLVNTVSPKTMGGWEGTALLIDTENTGDPLSQRIRDLILGNGIPEIEVEEHMSRITIITCPNSESQVNVMKSLLDNEKRFDTIVIDGLMTKFRAEFIGRGELAERQGLLGDHLDDIKMYAAMHKSLIVYTNQVTDTPDLYGQTVAIGGNIAGHAPAYRLMIRKGKDGKRVVRLDKAPNLPEGEAVFLLTSEGIADVKEVAN